MVVFFLAVAIVLALTGPVALVLVSLARRDIRRLENENSRLRARLSRGEAIDVIPADASAPTPAMTKPAAPLPDRKRRRDVESVIGGEWLTWIGIVTIFFGTAFFLAVDLGEHVLDGAGQIAVALLVSVVFILAGLRLSPAGPRSILSHGLVGGGIALLFLIAYGSYGFHRLVSAPVVYVFLAGVTAVGAALALRRNAMSIAVLTAIGALVTPLLLQTDADPARFLFPYTVLVVAGASHVGMRRRWPLLTVLAFAATAVLVSVWCVVHWTHALDPAERANRFIDDASRGIALVCGGLMWMLFATTPIVSAGRRRAWGTARDLVVLLAGLSFGWFVFVLLEPGYEPFRGLALALLAAAHVTGSRVLENRAGVDARSMLFYTGIALAVVAVPVQFDGSMTTLAWVMLGFVLLLSGIQRRRGTNRALGLAVYALVLGRLLVFDGYHAIADSEHAHPIVNASFLAGVFAVVVLIVSAVLVHRNRAHLLPTERHVVPALVVSAAVALWWRGTAETVLFFEAQRIAGGGAAAPTGRRILLAVSWVWATYAALLIAGEFIARYRPLRLLGVVVIGFLVAKVFLFDIQALERGYRIASFVGVGILLLIISAAYQRDRKSS